MHTLRRESVNDVNHAVCAIQGLANQIPGVFAPRVDIDEGYSRWRYFFRMKDIDQIVEALIRNARQAPDTGFPVHIPALNPGHDLEKCALAALG
jgi:hypothetical protein